MGGGDARRLYNCGDAGGEGVKGPSLSPSLSLAFFLPDLFCLLDDCIIVATGVARREEGKEGRRECGCGDVGRFRFSHIQFALEALKAASSGHSFSYLASIGERKVDKIR